MAITKENKTKRHERDSIDRSCIISGSLYNEDTTEKAKVGSNAIYVINGRK